MLGGAGGIDNGPLMLSRMTGDGGGIVDVLLLLLRAASALAVLKIRFGIDTRHLECWWTFASRFSVDARPSST